jgi:hypothetical protein
MINNTEISERVEQIINFLGLNAKSFSEKLGYVRAQVVYDIINKRSKPSFEFFDRLSKSEFCDIFNWEWIITGNGQMESEVTNKDSEINFKELVLQKMFEKRISDLEEFKRKVELSINIDLEINGNDFNSGKGSTLFDGIKE